MAARTDWIRGRTFSTVATPADFPREALVQVDTFDHENGELHFKARVVGPSSESHLRIRADDGLVFAVPAADCRIIEGEPT